MAEAPPPGPPPALTRAMSDGGIPVYRGSDIVVKDKAEKNFDGLAPRFDRVWFGPTTFEIAGDTYVLEKFLNYGAEGQAYSITRQSTNEKFVAKFVNKTDSAEIKLVQTLPRQLVVHPNFINFHVVVLDVKEQFAPAQHMIIMDHIPNGEVFEVLASSEPSVAGKPLSEGTSRRFLHDLIAGMAECYRFGITHRDLKPENLLINADGRIIIIDMGHAKRAEPPSDAGDGPPLPIPLARATTHNAYGALVLYWTALKSPTSMLKSRKTVSQSFLSKPCC